MKRILTIQDISCFGKCSMTIALPVISAIGVETVILPTALLSTHTLFPECTKLDLGGELMRIAQKWKENDIRFDAIYTGYLGTAEEVDTVIRIIDMFREEDTLVFTDPVMGDNGRLYRGFDEEYARRCTDLCRKADIIVPNITEACLMTGTEYRMEYDENYIAGLCRKLDELGTETVVITGVSLSEGKTGFYGMETRTGETFCYQNEKVRVSYHGTGDLFSSTAAGSIVRGISVPQALRIAADYTAETIRETLRNPGNPWYGVDFESTIPLLIQMVKDQL